MGNHAMIDVETLGVGSRAPIFEIGVCVFKLDEREIVGSKNIEIDLLDVILRTGFLPQPDTVLWWTAQEQQPSRSLIRTLKVALMELSSVIRDNEVQYVWANSPSFDLVLLGAHYAAIGQEPPWTYKQELDFRTMMFLGRRVGRSTSRTSEPVTHNGEEDAVKQTRILFDMIGDVDV